MSSLQSRYMDILNEAPVNIEALIKLFNIELDKQAELVDGILGEIRRQDDGKFKISVKKGDHYFRQRFTMAHELGHFMLHSNKLGDGINDNIRYRSDPSEGLYNRQIGDIEETEANKFAATTLMPKNLLLPYIKGWNGNIDSINLKEIATEFQVSPESMEIRLKSLHDDELNLVYRDAWVRFAAAALPVEMKAALEGLKDGSPVLCPANPASLVADDLLRQLKKRIEDGRL